MYQSPIDVIYGDIEVKFENSILSAVRKVDINVDKDELLKALKYDRDQYKKGYEDGKNTVIRCKDCKFWRTPNGENNYCDHDFAGLRCIPMADDYCSYAERREDEQTD